jgi:acetyltransferase-like isoleucine patch superfamily enzyme
MAKLFSTITGILWTLIVSRFRPAAGVVQIGAHTYGHPRIVSFLRGDMVSIGKFCSIADDVLMVPGGVHRYDRVSTFPLKSRLLEKREADACSKGPIVIGNDVWIGSRTTILSGVKVESGAVIAAGAVVTQNVPPYAIVAGVPARVVGYRFSKDQISRLLQIRWWDWSIRKITANIDFFYRDVDGFIKRFAEEN